MDAVAGMKSFANVGCDRQGVDMGEGKESSGCDVWAGKGKLPKLRRNTDSQQEVCVCVCVVEFILDFLHLWLHNGNTRIVCTSCRMGLF